MQQILKFKVSGMHCTACALNIDLSLEDLPGVEESRTNFARQVVEIKFDPEKVSEEKILATINAMGYAAEYG